MRPDFYTKTFDRALTKYVNNGFFSRYLDADDYAFLEHVRECGVANGQEPYTSGFLIEELDYWHFPYAVDYSAFRRHGPINKEKQPIIPDADGAARRAQRIRDREAAAQTRAAMEEEWKRQTRSLAEEREQRLRQTMQADLLWDAEHPKAAAEVSREEFARRYYSGPHPELPRRHYIPHWKREEKRKEQEAQERHARWADQLAKATRKKRRKLGLFRRDEMADILDKVRREWEPEEELV